MVLDFAALPPEINSSLMYAGAGSGPLMAAATAWSNLAAELSTTASSWESIVGTLTGEQWTGAGSAAAAAAAAPYISWLTTTSAAAEQAGAQASTAAAAYEAAFAGTVPPPVIAANRSLLAALVATNFLGINTPAIMATEAQYMEMWVQDALTMYTYAASAAASSVLQPLTPASPTASPAAAATQGAAVSTALASAQSNSAATGLSGLLANFGTESFGTEIWNAFSTAFPGPAEVLDAADGFFGTLFNFNLVQQFGVTAAWFVGNTIPTAVSFGHTVGAIPAVPWSTVDSVTPLAGGVAAEGALVNSVGGGGMSAGMAEASTVGGLSVPASWSSAAPATLASSTAPLEGSGWTAAAEAEPVAAMPGMPGMAGAAKGAAAYGSGPRYGFKPIVMPKQVVV
ncbi:PPE family protein [Mycobacterium terramassiliense]|uniref:PPE family protein n=1 Tax=Mycobacterium terramassiliense TaxID=1841859 RepID=A0A2U3NHP1_9MYCO|nr:PPE family protein [Mycobacterium terramassiliense]SPM31038.1 PPE family protein [Mycobacterium terramassiliense]